MHILYKVGNNSYKQTLVLSQKLSTGAVLEVVGGSV